MLFALIYRPQQVKRYEHNDRGQDDTKTKRSPESGTRIGAEYSANNGKQYPADKYGTKNNAEHDPVSYIVSVSGSLAGLFLVNGFFTVVVIFPTTSFPLSSSSEK